MIKQNPTRRVLPFRKVANFRDLGGYATADGQTVKWNRLYRSGNLSKLKGRDVRRFNALNLTTVIDFRAEMEREKEPNRLPDDHPARLLELPVADGGIREMTKDIEARMESGDFDGFDPLGDMREMYRRFVTEYSGQFRLFMETVRDANGAPILWHCTAGKDRTGFAAMILLRTLGVPDDVILADYLLSREHIERRRFMIWMIRRMRGDDVAEVIQSLLTVHADWLGAALATIDDQWGSFDRYRAEALCITDADVVRLQGVLLEGG